MTSCKKTKTGVALSCAAWHDRHSLRVTQTSLGRAVLFTTQKQSLAVGIFGQFTNSIKERKGQILVLAKE